MLTLCGENDITRRDVDVTNLTGWASSAVAAATGRGFKSRRPEKIFSPRITQMKHRFFVAEIIIDQCKSVFICG